MLDDQAATASSAAVATAAVPPVSLPTRPAPARFATVRGLFAGAERDRDLAAGLLALPAGDRLAAALHDPIYRRPSLAKLLALAAEATLFERGADARPLAELAAAVASVVPGDAHGGARRDEALALWLFGKALLQAGQRCLARHSFSTILALGPGGGPSEERALAIMGLAQAAADTCDPDAAHMRFLAAACLFADLGAAQGCCACHAELGLLLLDHGDLLAARDLLRTAGKLLDEAAAPALATRLRLALAEIAMVLGNPWAAAAEIERARALAPLLAGPAAASEELVRSWREGRVAAAAGDAERAEPLFDGVRRRLLAHGSLEEAARSTFDHLLLAIDARRFAVAEELIAALAGAFRGSGERWVREMEGLAILAAADPESVYRAGWQLRDRLRRPARDDPRRPPLLVPARLLCDRLVRRRTDLEDPIGAATGL